MWGSGAVSEEDRLDREQARRLLTRVALMLRPYRAAVIRTGLLVVVWTLTVVAGPLIVRYAIDHGLSDHNEAALNKSIVAYLVVAAVAYVVARLQIMAVGRIGEGFLRDLRVRVFNHMQSLSLGFFEREKAGVLVSRMTSDIDSMAELRAVRPAAVHLERPAPRALARPAHRHVVEARTRLPHRRCRSSRSRP